MCTQSKTNLQHVNITDAFWSRYLTLIKDEMIPFQWDALNDKGNIDIQKERNDDGLPSDKSNALENLKIAAGESEGDHYGWWFQDSDVYKWLESVANSLLHFSDTSLEELADSVIALIGKAQQEDGYINTYYQIKAPRLKFRRLFESHELYCAGHLIEAAIAYYEATGKGALLKIACKFADCIEENFGPEDGKIHGADGHQEIELALAKLFLCTGEGKYLKLSEYFLTIRGQDIDFYRKQLEENVKLDLSEGSIPKVHLKYMQAHKPVLEQATAEGHAVRLVYMCTAMADVAYYTGNKEILAACKQIWKNIVERRMYVTGGIGSTVHGEAFTFDYDLPNDTMYCETCAAIGLVYFAYNMLKNEPNSQYADIMERALYNNVISGMSLDGKHYFYVNPLESHPEANQYNPGKGHIKSTRPEWFGCACCPPNLARTVTAIGKYIYTIKENSIYTHLYFDHQGELQVNNQSISIAQKNNVDKGKVSIQINTENRISCAVHFRIPNWTRGHKILLNGKEVQNGIIQNGYMKLEKDWQGTEEIEIQFEIPVLKMTSHPKVRANIGKISVQRGPFIYCVEEEDNGPNLQLLSIAADTEFTVKKQDDVLGGIVFLEGKGKKLIISEDWKQHLYQYDCSDLYEATTITMIPYYAWGNRSVGEMQVWVNRGY